MFINLLRGSEAYKRRFMDLDRRLRLKVPTWIMDAEEYVHPEEYNFVTEMKSKYETLVSKLIEDGWLRLDSIWEGWLTPTKSVPVTPLQWLIREDSWCIVEVPFGDTFRLFTRSKHTHVRYAMTFQSDLFDWATHWDYVRDNCIVLLIPNNLDTIAETKEWCSTNCTDSYMIRSIPQIYLNDIEQPDLLSRSQGLVFVSPDDALKFRMTTTNVCRRIL